MQRHRTYSTLYQQPDGETQPAIQVPWPVVSRLLGHDHDGSPEDDAALIRALIAMGAPASIADAEGWADEEGWGLILAAQEV